MQIAKIYNKMTIEEFNSFIDVLEIYLHSDDKNYIKFYKLKKTTQLIVAPDNER